MGAAVAVRHWIMLDIVLQQVIGLQVFYGCYRNRLEVKLVEAGGIEPRPKASSDETPSDKE